MPGDVSVNAEMALQRVNLRQVRRDLAASTADLFPLEADRHDAGFSLRTGYVRELRRLNLGLDEPMAELISYMKSHDPQFLDGKIHINLPAID
jgi:predicted DNA-binding transcriptional regulator YafY